MKALLNLPIKHKWFDMIAAGKKKEEYRDEGSRQIVRAMISLMTTPRRGKSRHVAIFRNGYRMDSRAVAVEVDGFDLRDAGEAKHPEWGEPQGRRDYIVIKLGAALRVGPYDDIKEFVDRL